MSDVQFEASIIERVAAATGPLQICGRGSKRFLYGRDIGDYLPVSMHRGIIDYQPSELVVTARCGTSLAQLNEALAERGQVLAADPPQFGGDGTLGGAIAVGLSGPGRPWYGALRDCVLGVRLLTGHGEVHSFGGQVMKNVAGYDVARVQVGAHGTLGVVLAASLRVLPRPAVEATVTIDASRADAHATVVKLGRRPLPITATCWVAEKLHLRLSGTDQGVAHALDVVGGERGDASIWSVVRDHRLPFFDTHTGLALWRISLPVAAPFPDIAGEWLVEWGGALRWCRTTADAEHVRALVAALGGHAHEFSAPAGFARVDALVGTYQQRLKHAFDPKGIFNVDRVPGMG